jgi:hypothetical protein
VIAKKIAFICIQAIFMQHKWYVVIISSSAARRYQLKVIAFLWLGSILRTRFLAESEESGSNDIDFQSSLVTALANGATDDPAVRTDNHSLHEIKVL